MNISYLFQHTVDSVSFYFGVKLLQIKIYTIPARIIMMHYHK